MIVVAGSINVDYTAHVPRLPEKGETVIGGTFEISPGGKGANQAVAAARMGGRVRFVGRVGRDDAGRMMKATLRKAGINVSAVRDDRKPTGAAAILVDESGEGLIGVDSGANLSVRASDAPRFRPGDILLMQLEIPIPTVETLLRRAHRAGVFTILDPAPASKVSLEHVDLISPNEGEAEALTGKKDPVKAGRELIRQGAGQALIRIGKSGCVYVGPETVRRFRAPRVKPASTVGAGDCFMGSLAASLSRGATLADAIRFATAAAALKIQRVGAQNLPSRAAVDQSLK